MFFPFRINLFTTTHFLSRTTFCEFSRKSDNSRRDVATLQACVYGIERSKETICFALKHHVPTKCITDIIRSLQDGELS